MGYKLMTPNEIWAGYDPVKDDLKVKSIDKCGNMECFTFDASLDCEPSPIYCKVFKANSKKTLLIVGSYYELTDESIVDNLYSSGYNIVEVDYTGIYNNSETKYCSALSYGNIENAGHHLSSISESAFDSSLNLYTKVIRRAISFVNEIIKDSEVVVIGIQEGVDISIKTAGLDKRVAGLVCINGASYSEYLKSNHYDLKNSLEMDEERMAYMVGVASSAYVKHIKCPTIIGVGSNSEKADIDRLSNFISLFPEETKKLFTITPRAKDYIDSFSFTTIKKGIADIFARQPLRENPLMKIEENEEGKIYIYITNKVINLKIESISVYFAVNEINRRYRNYKCIKGESVSQNEYIASINIEKGMVELFVFAEIIYEDGSRLSTLPDFITIENEEERVRPIKRLVYSNTENNHTFVAETSLPILLGYGLKRVQNKLGLTELSSTTNDLVSYEIGEPDYIKENITLQIDINSNTVNAIEIILGTYENNEAKEYTSPIEVEPTGETFDDYFFEPNDFKDKEFISLDNFLCVKYIRIKGEKPFAIGNIILI